MKREFEHDCKVCEFLGHWFGHDVYLCRGGMLGGSIVARYGDDGPEYASSPISILENQFGNPQHLITVLDGTTMPFSDYLFSHHAGECDKAWLMGLALLKVRDVIEGGGQ